MNHFVLRASASAGMATIQVILLMSVAVLVIVTGVVLFNPPGKQAQTFDQQKKLDLTVLQQALESYAGNHNGQYPSTLVTSSVYKTLDGHQPQCYLCGLDEYQDNNNTGVAFTRDNWVPELVDKGYLPKLPLDPQTGDKTVGLCAAGGWPRGYVYFSNGRDYKLVDFCTPTLNLNFTAGPTSPYCTGSNQDVLVPNPPDKPALASFADPKQPSFHYAIYSPGWACK